MSIENTGAGNIRIELLPDPERAFGAALPSPDRYADRLAGHGYVTDEYRFAGEASGGRFATRLLVRRPAPEAASGVCVVEPMHFGGGRSFWGHAHEQLVRAGHAWVEVACQTHPALTYLVPSDPERYGWVSLPGRTTGLKSQIGPGIDTRAASDAFSSEWWATSPLLFGILDAAVDAVGRGRLENVSPSTVILAGASQSGGVVRRYAEKVARGELPRRVDGFLPLHSGGQPLPAELSVPTYELLAEAEIESVRSAAGLPGQGRDLLHRDCASPFYRFIEVAGMAHNDARYAVPDQDPPARSRWSSFPHTHVVHAALEGLIRWIRGGEPPLDCAPLEAAPDGSLARDDFGHPRGGLQVPAVEQPTARIHAISSGKYWNRGHEFPLPADELLARYGSAQGYLDEAERTLKELVGRGHYLEADARRWLGEAREDAGTWTTSTGN
ncbi:alpha/beta hydrolase domain-containing protein [Arthrobacter ginkgonis]|uniref:alpha/beta hydrolase domain-containing protein n=1 Tax=Arthrobacter ginkgonis TaxID=1630594 RepID=UPI0031E56FFA